MNASRLFAWSVAAATVLLLLLTAEWAEAPALTTFAFWIALAAAADLLAVALEARATVTMAFPIWLAVAILFREQPWVAMLIAALSTVDVDEIKREMPVHKALFNRSLSALSVGAASLAFWRGDGVAGVEPLPVGLAAVLYVVTELSLISVAIRLERRAPFREVLAMLIPAPAGGFALSYALLAGLGAATALAAERLGSWVAAAILIPLLFARLSIVGARTQQQLSEKLQTQQKALLEASERVFHEREEERKRIAEHIHDSSLQLLAAASYGAGNALDLLKAGSPERARDSIDTTRRALDEAVAVLRGSLADLRRSSVEAGGFKDTIYKFADQVSTLWGFQVSVEGEVRHEPPAPVALAAFQILQEGLVNALKHSRSDTISVRINDDDGRIHIVVEDEGMGFDPEAEVSPDHVGVRLMRERAESLGGHIDLVSAPGSGTRLEAILPGGVAR